MLCLLDVSLVNYIQSFADNFSFELAHAAYFSIFESIKVLTGADQKGHHPQAAAISGATAALSHDMIMTPFDTVKQRMQLGHYKSLLHCFRSTIKKEGVRALYVSLPTTLVMNLPYGSIMVAMNESVRKALNPSGSYRLDVSMLAGSVAGATAALLTNPLDVIKTRLQVQDLQPCPLGQAKVNPVKLSTHRYTGTVAVFNEIVAQEGPLAFFRGAWLRMLVHAPSVAVSWTAYDSAKRLLAVNSSFSQKRH